jgi:hypothetical protein
MGYLGHIFDAHHLRKLGSQSECCVRLPFFTWAIRGDTLPITIQDHRSIHLTYRLPQVIGMKYRGI